MLLVRIVVFDFDGTLVDSNALKRAGFLRAVQGDAGGEERMSGVLDRVEGSRRDVFAAYVADAAEGDAGAPDAITRIDALTAAFSDWVDAEVVAAPEMPGATALLAALRPAGFAVFLSSATPEVNLRRIVARRGWQAHFDDLFGHPRTKAATLRHLIDRTGLPADAIAVVGDGADDRDSAHAVGCRHWPVGEARGTPRGERVHTLTELRALLGARAAAVPCI